MAKLNHCRFADSIVAKRAPRRIALALRSLTTLAILASIAERGLSQDSQPAGLLTQQQLVFRAALKAAAPAIVKIETIGGAQPVAEEGEAPGAPRAAAGFRTADGPTTGVIWSEDGYILSSTFNFVRDPSIITVSLADGRRFVGKLIARDHQSRLALLKVEASGLPTPTWVAQDKLKSGQWAITAGFGYGSAEPAVSIGIVSGLDRMSGQAIQTDAKTSPANYGGPLLDIEGRLLGVCVPLGAGEDQFAGVESYDSGIGFALHVDHIRRRLPRMMKGEDLKRGLLGVSVDIRDPIVGLPDPATEPPASQPTTAGRRPEPRDDEPPPAPATQDSSSNSARPLYVGGSPRGLRIIEDPRGPALDAELKKGDEITHIDGLPTPKLLDFRRALARKSAGDSVEVTYQRDGEARTATIKLAAADDFKGHPTTQPR